MGGTHQKESLLGGAGVKGAAEPNYGSTKEHKEVRDGRTGGVQGLFGEDESRINEAALYVKESHVLEAAAVVHNPVLEKQQHQMLAAVVQWERFLPLRTIKVLLVENDDCTRQVLSALLRNCCYEVTAVANVLEAWRVLEDLTNRIDLVLTEVVMPSFSGVGLLCKIMSHKMCKTIPVIMMSSNDSMGIVFKCLSKGAVDFLVKPIRKNELKNLWQHVWRRCHSSSGSRSGSESGIQGQKMTKSDNEDISDNNTDSDEEDNGSIGWNARDESDNGSGTQSSWRGRAIEVDSPQPMSPSEQIVGPQDSTWAQLVHPRQETFCSMQMTLNTCVDSKEQKKTADDIMAKDLEIGGILKSTDIRDELYQTDKISTKLTGLTTDNTLENGVRCVNNNALHDPNSQSAGQLGGDTNQQLEFTVADATSRAYSKISENKECMELSSFELSLKRLRSTGEVGVPLSDERLSNLSAFSRYPVSTASVQVPTVCGGSSLLNNSSEAVLLNQISNGNSEYNDMGSTNKKCNRSVSAFHPVQPQNSTIQLTAHEKIGEVAASPVTGQSRNFIFHHHHHHHVRALHPEPDQNDSSLENLKTTAGNYSLNGSNSCSNHGSDGQNGCLGGTNMEKGSNGSGSGGGGGGDGGGGGADQNRFAHREAALNKFRQKRKARNFSKKVRYQSRKRLAEQRPRFRGQFVRGGSAICSENHEANS